MAIPVSPRALAVERGRIFVFILIRQWGVGRSVWVFGRPGVLLSDFWNGASVCLGISCWEIERGIPARTRYV